VPSNAAYSSFDSGVYRGLLRVHESNCSLFLKRVYRYFEVQIDFTSDLCFGEYLIVSFQGQKS
jgi:hypothetical protein